MTNSLGFTLIEVLISLLILSLMLLGFDAMEIFALQESRNAYFFSMAEHQVHSMAMRLLISDISKEEQVVNWNKQNQELLPQGKGYVTGFYPAYKIILFWGEKTNKQTCDGIQRGVLKCLTLQM